MSLANDDLTLWHQYKAGDEQAKWELLKRFKGPIGKATAQHSNVLPRPVVEAKLKRYAVMAFDSYDPTKNVKLSTHVINYMQKINRDNYQHQQSIRLPENIAIGYGRFTDAQKVLTESLKRDPTDHELAEHLGWSPSAVTNARNKYHKEFVEGKATFDSGVSDMDTSSSVLRFVYHGLSNHDKYILERRTGYNGHPIESPEKIQKDLGITSYQFYQAQNKIRSQLEEAANVLHGDT